MPTNLDTIRNKIIDEFYDNSIMLNVAMNIEYFLCEEAIIYPYKNWFKGELVSGPFIRRYNVSAIFRYEYEDMPDPEGALVLKRFGVLAEYRKVNELVPDPEAEEGTDAKEVKKPAWYIILNFPKDLVSDEDQNRSLDMMDDMLDLEALEAASNDNMEQDSAFEMDDGFGDEFGGEENPEGDEMSDENPEEV